LLFFNFYFIAEFIAKLRSHQIVSVQSNQ